MMVSKRRLGGRGNIAHLLTNRVHFACFARVQSFGWDSRKSPDASDYRCLWIGIRKTPYGVRIPVVRLREHVSTLTAIRETETMGADGQSPLMITSAYLRARSLDEPGAGIQHAGISEEAVGQPAFLQ